METCILHGRLEGAVQDEMGRAALECGKAGSPEEAKEFALFVVARKKGTGDVASAGLEHRVDLIQREVAIGEGAAESRFHGKKEQSPWAKDPSDFSKGALGR